MPARKLTSRKSVEGVLSRGGDWKRNHWDGHMCNEGWGLGFWGSEEHDEKAGGRKPNKSKFIMD